MKAIAITIKPKWAKLIGNGDKTLEIRTSVALANAISKLIAKYGKARIYVVISKEKSKKEQLYFLRNSCKYPLQEEPHYALRGDMNYPEMMHNAPISVNDKLNGKVAFMFECEKVEEITYYPKKPYDRYGTPYRANYDLLFDSCLEYDELDNYLNKQNGYAIRISNLTRFEKPKEIGELVYKGCNFGVCHCCKVCEYCNKGQKIPLTKSPQNFAYVEVENENHGR